jgi:aminobenzoyl-glutamate transport protein
MTAQPLLLNRFLTRIEVIGNRLPHPTLLFIYLCGFILALSWLCAWLGVGALHPVNGNAVSAVNLLNTEGLQRILANAVTNFTQFAPVGTVLVAIMGIGVAEHSGLLSAVLRATVIKAPAKLLTFTIVLAGVLSSLAADTGYVVLIPLAAMIFAAVGRSPVVGIAAAFAGVSGGYSANLLIGPLDAILAGISTEAARLVEPGYEVSAAGNYYFILASTFMIAAVGTWVTERWIEPRFPHDGTDAGGVEALKPYEKRALKAVGVFSLVFVGILLWGLVPETGALRHPETGSILRSPFIKGIVTIIAVYAALAGLLYGKVSGSFRRGQDFVLGMEKSMATMASYLVLMFFAAQFVSYFGWSQLGIIAAINGAELLQQLQLNTTFLLVGFILLAAMINLLVGSASAKWALIAPVFVPMLLLTGISPEATQVAYRIGDSSTNIITPLMPYFGVVVAFVQQYDKQAGIGTIVAAMLPYSVMFTVAWSLLLIGWILLGLPLGPGAGIFVN